MEVNPETLESDYDQFITEVVSNAEGEVLENVRAFDIDVKKESKKPLDERLLPLFIYEDGSRTNYIVPMQGLGLWGPISAYLALEENLNTVHGVVFNHEKETPGLGAEITTASFQAQFKGKQIYEEDGSFASIAVLKGSGNNIQGRPHLVDGVSGATMTSNGVTEMFRDELNNYTPYFNKIRS
jgi:Na+-transporting NADH:ubiquinone oxidoreductase subunit C